MRLLHAADGRLAFQFRRGEMEILRELRSLYPLVPAAHHQLSKTAGELRDAQQLLDEALAERRQENKRQLDRWLNDPQRFVPSEKGHTVRLQLTTAEADWLLQVINDIRVGSWLRLGSPDPHAERKLVLTEENARYFWAMELCGAFEMLLLRALDQAGGEAPRTA